MKYIIDLIIYCRDVIVFILFILFLFYSVSVSVNACENNRVSVSLASYHVTTNYKPDNLASYNQTNMGTSFECGINDNLYVEAGFYNNSIYKLSKHIGIILNKKYDSFEIGSNVGFVTGYNKNVILFARPYIQYNSIRLGYIPKLDKLKTDSVITLEFVLEI